MRNYVKEALDNIIDSKKIKAVFQPIISLKDGSVLGHEALSRITEDSVIQCPEMLFSVAEECNRLWDLELLCRLKALEAAFKFMVPPYSKLLFINVNPNTLHDEKFIKGFTKEFLMQFQIEPQNVIFEITERNVITDRNSFLSTINHYRNQDYRIAVDDAGAGYSGLNLISDINPNYIKLDMNLIRNVDADSLKYALVKGMVELSKEAHINLIAEGIEKREELEALICLGVQYGQGYYIQKPSEEVCDIDQNVIRDVIEINQSFLIECSSNKLNSHILKLCRCTGMVSSEVTVDYVSGIFKQNPSASGLCIVENEIPQGVINYDKFINKIGGKFQHQDKPATEYMDRSFLSVDSQTPFHTVAALAMSRTKDKLYDAIVVTKNKKYVGTVTVKDLLCYASD